MALREILAKLTIKVDTRPLKRAADMLDKMAPALRKVDKSFANVSQRGGRTASVLKEIGDQAKRAQSSLRRVGDGVSGKLAKVNAVGTAGGGAGLAAGVAGAVAAGAAVEKAGKKAAKAGIESAIGARAGKRGIDEWLEAMDGARKTGGSLLNTMAKFRRIFGLFQFSAAVFAVGKFASGALKAADRFGKLAAQLRVTTDEIQVLSAFAETSGTSVDALALGYRNLARNVRDASNGSKTSVLAFKDLNVEFKKGEEPRRDLLNMLVEVGGALNDTTNDAKRLAITQQLLGRSGSELLPGFRGGTEAIKKQMTMLQEIAVVYDKDFIARAEQANDEMFLAGLQFQKTRAQIINLFLPAIRLVVSKLTSMAQKINEVTRISEIFKATFLILGGKALQFVFSKLGALVARFGGLGAVLRRIIPLVLRFLAPFLILDDILVTLEGGDSLIRRIIDSLTYKGATADGVNTLKGAWAGLLAVFSDDEETVKHSRKRLQELFDTMPNWADITTGFIVSVAASMSIFWNSLTGDTEDLEKAKQVLKQIRDNTKDLEIDDPIFRSWDEFFGSMAFGFEELGTGIRDFYDTVLTRGRAFSAKFMATEDRLIDYVASAWDAFDFSSFDGVMRGLRETFGLFADGLATDAENLWAIIVQDWESNYQPVLEKAWSSVATFFKEDVVETMTTVWDGFGTAFKETVDSVVSYFKEKFPAVTKAISSVADFLGLGGDGTPNANPVDTAQAKESAAKAAAKLAATLYGPLTNGSAATATVPAQSGGGKTVTIVDNSKAEFSYNGVTPQNEPQARAKSSRDFAGNLERKRSAILQGALQ